MKGWTTSAGSNVQIGHSGPGKAFGCHSQGEGLAPSSHRVCIVTAQVRIVSALPFGFFMTWSEYLLADLHGPEEAAVSGRHLVGACWPRKLPMAHTFAAHRLCHALEACDLAFCVILGPFQADAESSLGYGLGEVQRVNGLLDFVSAGRPGHGLVHLLVEFVFAWDSGEEGRFRLGQHPTRMLAGLLWHLLATILDAWRFSRLWTRMEVRGGPLLDVQGIPRLHSDY